MASIKALVSPIPILSDCELGFNVGSGSFFSGMGLNKESSLSPDV